MSSPKLWLVTGASSGLGLAIALSALQAGHKVIACARNPTKAAADHPTLESKAKVEKVVEEEHGIDVVVNNAGHALQGPIEDVSEEQTRQQMDVSFFGAIRILKAVIPSMRARRSGTIVSMSSIFGFAASAEVPIYSAAKFALEGLSESLASSLKPFDIRVIILEPGVFQSNLATACDFPPNGLSKDYQECMAGWFQYVEAARKDKTVMPGDPEKLGDRTVEAVDGTGFASKLDQSTLLRLVLGPDAVGMWKGKLDQLNENFDMVKEVAMSTNSS